VAAHDDAIDQARRRLADALVTFRRDTALKQADLARRIAFDRTTVSHAERGSQVPAIEFWQSCDEVFQTDGTLVRLYDEWKSARQRKADAEAARTRAERHRRAQALRSNPAPGGVPAGVLPGDWTALDGDEIAHMTAAREDSHRYLDDSVIGYFEREFGACEAADGAIGPARTLPMVRGLLAAIEHRARDSKPDLRRGLLSVAARGSEFAGWLCRDLRRFSDAQHWHERATAYALEAGDLPMVGYVLLRKAQMAYDKREPLQVLTLAAAAREGPWQLAPRTRAEVILTETHGLAMTGSSADVIERQVDDAHALATGDHSDGPTIDDATLLLRSASCFTESARPEHAAAIYEEVLSTTVLSRRDEGYFLARRSYALALAGETNEAFSTGLSSIETALTANSARTRRELQRTVHTLTSAGRLDDAVELRDALTSWQRSDRGAEPVDDR
jgi:DNA-binding XRE family transcriptional regulator